MKAPPGPVAPNGLNKAGCVVYTTHPSSGQVTSLADARPSPLGPTEIPRTSVILSCY